jgi:hypothetical protein
VLAGRVEFVDRPVPAQPVLVHCRPVGREGPIGLSAQVRRVRAVGQGCVQLAETADVGSLERRSVAAAVTSLAGFPQDAVGGVQAGGGGGGVG